MKNQPVPSHVQQVLAKFRSLRSTRDGWDAQCPCPDHNHDGDQHPSLRIALGEDGRILLKCRVGCQTDTVLEAAGLDWIDLFPKGEPDIREETPSVTSTSKKPNQKADEEICHHVYEELLGTLILAPEHENNLKKRGLSAEEIGRRGYRSLRNTDRGKAAHAVFEKHGNLIYQVPGFVQGSYGPTLRGESTGLLFPVRDPQGRIQALKIRRAGEPKYVYLTSDEAGISPGSPCHTPLGVLTPSSLVRVTEGELKADICTALDSTPTIGVPGVTQWQHAIPVLKQLGAQTVILAYDSPDVHTKPPVFEQAEAFWQGLIADGFEVQLEDWYEPIQGA